MRNTGGWDILVSNIGAISVVVEKTEGKTYAGGVKFAAWFLLTAHQMEPRYMPVIRTSLNFTGSSHGGSTW